MTHDGRRRSPRAAARGAVRPLRPRPHRRRARGTARHRARVGARPSRLGGAAAAAARSRTARDVPRRRERERQVDADRGARGRDRLRGRRREHEGQALGRGPSPAAQGGRRGPARRPGRWTRSSPRAESFSDFASAAESEASRWRWRTSSDAGCTSSRTASRSSPSIMKRFGRRGLYILDEPEAALSPQRQLSLLPRMHELVTSIAVHHRDALADPDGVSEGADLPTRPQRHRRSSTRRASTFGYARLPRGSRPVPASPVRRRLDEDAGRASHRPAGLTGLSAPGRIRPVRRRRKRPPLRQHRLKAVAEPHGRGRFAQPLEQLLLASGTFRSPRLTAVSDGKPAGACWSARKDGSSDVCRVAH